MTLLFVVRHAEALERSQWRATDDSRPLTSVGEQQAAALAKQIVPRGEPIVVVSPTVRCRDTMAPFAVYHGVAVREEPSLAEGSTAEDVLALSTSTGHSSAIVCTHGDVIGDLLAYCARSGAHLVDSAHATVASMWVLEIVDGAVKTAQYVPPPSV